MSLSQLETYLIEHVKRYYLPNKKQNPKHASIFSKKDLFFFGASVAKLSAGFTSERKKLPQNYLNQKEFRSSYLLYFVLTNFAKILHILEQIKTLNAFTQKEEVNILDLGAGPLTASLAVSSFFKTHFPKQKINIYALEQNKHILQDGEKLFQKLAPSHHKLHPLCKRFSLSDKVLGKKSFDLIIAANMFNELMGEEQLERMLVGVVRQHLNKNGLFLLVEPATQKASRVLMELRNSLSEHLHLLAPCLHQKTCPMLAHNKRDWCHFYIEWNCPDLIRTLDDALGNKHEYLKMAYFVGKKINKPTKTSEDLWRIVSSPLLSKGKSELNLCGDCGEMKKIALLHRDFNKKNDPFAQAKRGDILSWPKNKSRLQKGEVLKTKLHWSRVK